MSLQPLPKCRHRGNAAGQDRWVCNSPKLVVPGGAVSGATCRAHCPFVDHSPQAHGEPRTNGAIPRGVVPLLPRRLDVPIVFRSVSVGVTVVKRTPPTLGQCLASLKAAGFNNVRVFADDRFQVSAEDRRLCNNVIQRGYRFGAWRNFVQSVRDLLRLEPSSDGLLLVQDDAVFCRNVAALLSQSQPDTNTGVILLGTPKVYEGDGHGLVQLNRKQANDLRAAWALLFPRGAAEALVNHDLAHDWQGWANRRIERVEDRKGIDTFVGRVMNRIGLACYAYVPSLVDHIGMSTLGHGPPRGNRSAASFPGADADACHVHRTRHSAMRPGKRFANTVAVVIPCHNYGRFLAEAIESVLRQTRRPDEIVVVDDASTDDTHEIAASFQSKGVRYERVEHRQSQLARKTGFASTRSDVLCFLDADDRLSPTYLEDGLSEFATPEIGIVYSDIETFGTENRQLRYPTIYSLAAIEKANYMHAGALVLREALKISQALEAISIDGCGQVDWLLWRKVLRCGWQARKQKSIYHYRKHNRSMSYSRRQRSVGRNDYFDRASMQNETLTLFVPLSGRVGLWPNLADFLDRQFWPHDQIKLVLMDTSQDKHFSETARSWLLSCDYSDVRYFQETVGALNLADMPRRQVAREVSLAMSRIYNRMAREATTNYIWVVEDDVLPPDDACEQLLRGFDENTGSVSAAYWSRFANGYVAWRSNQQRFRQKGAGIQTVGGNGFGCVILRGHLVRDTVFTATVDFPAFDNAFYFRLPTTGLSAKLNWSVECEHHPVSS